MSESCAGLGTGLLATRSAVARAHVGNTIVRGIEASESNPTLMNWLRQFVRYADSDVDDHRRCYSTQDVTFGIVAY